MPSYNKEIFIPNTQKVIGEDDVFVIAEIGKNFIQTKEERPVEEYLQNAKDLVDAAVDAGADAVKFQTHEIEDEQMDVDIISPHFRGSDRYSWVKRNTEATPIEEFWKPLKEYCDEKGIIFFSTPMSRKAAIKLEKVGVPMWKVGSGDVSDYAMLDFLVSTKKPIIISSGMVSLSELDEIMGYLRSKNTPIVLLYCVSKYPAPPEYFNLSTIEHLKEKYPESVVGFSDHSLGSDAALSAVKLGARVIEKHFSLNRDLWGSDHKVSMTPSEMKEMVIAIRDGSYKDIDEAPYYGTKERELDGSHNEFRPYFNKALVAGEDVTAGTVLTKEMVFAMRPLMHIDGLPANRFYDVIGKHLKRGLDKYEPIKQEDLE